MLFLYTNRKLCVRKVNMREKTINKLLDHNLKLRQGMKVWICIFWAFQYFDCCEREREREEARAQSFPPRCCRLLVSSVRYTLLSIYPSISSPSIYLYAFSLSIYLPPPLYPSIRLLCLCLSMPLLICLLPPRTLPDYSSTSIPSSNLPPFPPSSLTTRPHSTLSLSLSFSLSLSHSPWQNIFVSAVYESRGDPNNAEKVLRIILITNIFFITFIC